ncbi:S-phase kinase-associated protein 1-like [Drosophila busckii]|uniref:S-phase kinase-associated protein 1-like n=1 Tax=Drosophila busckii TaxID=30019 RepID=UPI0014330864|nr:S-phase kinase-associated protein 1-like [Drosophila busckii]
MPRIKLQTSDGKIFDTDVEVAKCSQTIAKLLESSELQSGGDGDDNDDDDDDDYDGDIVPLSNINARTLGKVLQWSEHNMAVAAGKVPPESDSSWERQFLDVEQCVLFELMLAANYLDIKELLDLTCKRVADMIHGKSTAEIQQIFNIPQTHSQHD